MKTFLILVVVIVLVFTISVRVNAAEPPVLFSYLPLYTQYIMFFYPTTYGFSYQNTNIIGLYLRIPIYITSPVIMVTYLLVPVHFLFIYPPFIFYRPPPSAVEGERPMDNPF